MKTDTDADSSSLLLPGVGFVVVQYMGKAHQRRDHRTGPEHEDIRKMVVQSFGTIVWYIVWFNRLVQSVHLSVAAL